MDFFAHQDHARRLTKRLVVLFFIAVVAVVAAVNAVAVYFFGWDVSAHVVVSLMTLAVIAGGTLYKLIELRAGGQAVAESVGGRRVATNTIDFHEKRLLNVVEEMALASGVAVPAVYVLDDEEAINAFAAGLTIDDAVVAVTRGTLTKLSREELQGVVAHEFSHILNGDMALNLRMIGVLHGILVISLIGYTIMRVSGQSRSSRNRDNGSIFLFGLALYAIGYIGKFAADVIKAAVSRQREYLADASAVQFTRNPEGIGGALVKIGLEGSRLDNPHAEEVSHMFLGEGVRIASLLATHPPVDERVGRLLGERNGADLRRRLAGELAASAERADGAWGARTETSSAAAMGFAAGAAEVAHTAGAAVTDAPRAAPGAGIGSTPASVLGTVGKPSAAHVDYAHDLLARMPMRLRERLATPEGARGAVFALLLQGGVDGEGRRILPDTPGVEGELALAAGMGADIAALGQAARLPIVDLAVPALRLLPAPDRRALLAKLRRLAMADARLDAFELVLLAVLTQQLDDTLGRAAPVRHRSFATVKDEVALVISVFVRAASQGSVLFERTMAALDISGATLVAPSRIDFDRVEGALIALRGLAPLVKPRLIKACLEIVMADGRIAVYESELMRAVCAMLDAPLPPLLDVQRPRQPDATPAPGAIA